MEKLVILNFDTSEIHVYDVDTESENTEDLIKNLGHNSNACSWMFAEELKIICHKEVVK